MRDDLEQTSKERDVIQKNLNRLTEEHKVLEGLRDHLESELRNVQVHPPLYMTTGNQIRCVEVRCERHHQ